MNKIRINNAEDLGQLISAIAAMDYRCNVRITRQQRTLDQNSLYWLWLGQLSDYFTLRGHDVTKDEVHDLMRHKWLGYEERLIGKTVINKLRSTTELDKGEFTNYLTLIDSWAIDNGCMLTKPADSEYMEIMQSMDQAT